MSEIEVTDRPPIPPLLVQLLRGLIFTVDLDHGLRVFDLKGSQKLLATEGLSCEDTGPPTALAADSYGVDDDSTLVTVGFESGQFRIYQFGQESGRNQASSFALVFQRYCLRHWLFLAPIS